MRVERKLEREFLVRVPYVPCGLSPWVGGFPPHDPLGMRSILGVCLPLGPSCPTGGVGGVTRCNGGQGVIRGEGGHYIQMCRWTEDVG